MVGQHSKRFVSTYAQIWNNYWRGFPVDKFWYWYRMRKLLFLRIHDVVVKNDLYFGEKMDKLGRPSLSSLWKITIAMPLFVREVATNGVDEYLRIGDLPITIKYLKWFAIVVIQIFCAKYLCHSIIADVLHYLQINEICRFPWMFGSIDLYPLDVEKLSTWLARLISW